MFVVQYSNLGSGVWASPNLPMTYQAATGQAQATASKPYVAAVKIVASPIRPSPPSRLLDITA